MSSSSFNCLSPAAIKRISCERRIIEKDRERLANEDEVFFWWESADITRDYKQLIVGPSDTPYEGGFFFFRAEFPDQYPLMPMTMRAMTQGLNFRQHPNFYICGKCCLSILNTWSGPPWVATLDMCKVAMTMKSMFTVNPLSNEPGYEKHTRCHPMCASYEAQVEYWTLRIAILEMVRNPPVGFEVFLPECKRRFLRDYPKYISRIEKLREGLDEKLIWNCKLTIDKRGLLKEFDDTYRQLAPAPVPAPAPDPAPEDIIEDPGETRPESKPRDLEEGAKARTRDGRMWVVKKANGLRWVLAAT